MDVVAETEDRVFGMPREVHAVLAPGEPKLEQSLVRLLGVNGVLGHALVSARVDAALRSRIVHPVLAVQPDDVRGENVLVVELTLVAQGKSRLVTVPAPVVGLKPGLKRWAFLGRRGGSVVEAEKQKGAERGCQAKGRRWAPVCFVDLFHRQSPVPATRKQSRHRGPTATSRRE